MKTGKPARDLRRQSDVLVEHLLEASLADTESRGEFPHRNPSARRADPSNRLRGAGIRRHAPAAEPLEQHLLERCRAHRAVWRCGEPIQRVTCI